MTDPSFRTASAVTGGDVALTAIPTKAVYGLVGLLEKSVSQKWNGLAKDSRFRGSRKDFCMDGFVLPLLDLFSRPGHSFFNT